jgi:hypothetical protein
MILDAEGELTEAIRLEDKSAKGKSGGVVYISTRLKEALVDPRQSRVDIAQAVGRAMRKPRGPSPKQLGYVLVPLFAGMDEEDDLDAAIKSEKFEAVADVLAALLEHDDELIDIIREIREARGRSEPFNPRALGDKLEVIGPFIDLSRLTESIQVRTTDRLGRSWDQFYGALVQFKDREGHCRVPGGHVEDGLKLGRSRSAITVS